MGMTGTESHVDGNAFYLSPLTELEAPQGLLVRQ